MTSKTFTYEEVFKHNLPDDCWVIIDGGVYDVTTYLNQHPGGPIVLQTRAGCVASNAYRNANHSNQATNVIMPKYKIGNLDLTSVPVPEQVQRQSKTANILGIVLILVMILGLGYSFLER